MLGVSAYIFIEITVDDPARLAPYQALALSTMKEHGIRLLGKTPEPAVLEGEPPKALVVVLQADSVEAAKAWYTSPAYSKAVDARRGVATFTTRVVPAAG